MKPSIFLQILATAMALILASCVPPMSALTSTKDSSFDRLQAATETNPSKDAIVGMWHRRDDKPIYGVNSRNTQLYRSDGTAILRTYAAGGGKEFLESHEGKWTYLGNGVWRTTIQYDTGASSYEIRISGGHLLMTFRTDAGALHQTIYDRVN